MEKIIIDNRHKQLSELTEDEIQARSEKTMRAIEQKAWAMDSYISYDDDVLCPDCHHTIHEYKDRKELIFMDDDYKQHLVKVWMK